MSFTIGQLVCRHYGFDCDFTTKEDLLENIITEFRVHTLEEHFIDYPEGVLMRFITRKK